MPQTILALFALMLTSTFALQQSRHAMRTQLDVIEREVDTHARGVASEMFADIGGLAYDLYTIDSEVPVPPNGMTPESGFQIGLVWDKDNPAEDDIDDVDDVHRMEPRRFEREVTTPSGERATLTYEVTATVDYAEEAFEGGGRVIRPTRDNRRTYTKLVVLTIRCLDLQGVRWGGGDYSITIARPFSYSPAGL